MGIINTKTRLNASLVLAKYKISVSGHLRTALCAPLWLALASSNVSLAIAESRFLPTLSLEQSFLKNETSTSNESGQITRISPGLRYLATGARSNLSINYAINALYYSNLSQDDKTDQSLQLDADIDHVAKRWNSYLTSTIQQTNVSRDGVQILNPNIQSSNTSELRTSKVGTALNGGWGEAVNYEAGVSADYADFEDSDDTRGVSGYFGLSSRKSQSKVNWNTSISTNKTTILDRDEQIDTVRAGLDYRVNRRYALFLTAEKNDTNSDDGFLNETNKILGIQWTPDKNTSLSLGIGSRGEETSYSLDAIKTARRATFTANYAETVTTSRVLLIDQAENPEEFTPTSLSLSITPVLIKNGRISMTTSGRRSDLTLSYYKQTTDRSVGTGDDETADGLSIDFNRTLSANSSLGAGISRQRSETLSQKNTVDDASISYSRQLSRKSDIVIVLRTTEQTSDVAENEYKQDLLSFQLDVDF